MAKNRNFISGLGLRPDTPSRGLAHQLLGETGRDVRRPLWTVLSSAQLLLRSRELSPRDARLVDRIDAAAHRLACLARDLLDQALVETGGRMALTPVPMHMREVSAEALAEARVDRPDRWILQAGTGDGAATWDHDRVLQLLSNLLGHALEHGSEDSPISFAWHGEGDEVVIEIEYDADSFGCDPAWTLGLSVAREIARAHGGELEIHDAASGRLLRAALPRGGPASCEVRVGTCDAEPVASDGAA